MMKKILLALSLLISVFANAQVGKPQPQSKIRVGNTSNIATDTPFVNDLNTVAQFSMWIAAQGDTASSTVSGYSSHSVDSLNYYFTTLAGGLNSYNGNGGWLANSTSGDSIIVNTPIGVVFGNSIVAGHPYRNSGLEIGNIDYPDSFGQISYRLTQLTNFKWQNRGWGGQYITTNMRARFMRDVIAINNGSSSDDVYGTTPTLGHRPIYVVIEGGVNDVYLGATTQQIEATMLWMAQTCMQYGIGCVMLNIVGDGTYTQAQVAQISAINKWMASGILQQYNCTVVDENSLWNNPAYGNDNIHYSSYVNSGDKIHFTQAGYDSVGKLIFNVAKLPVLTKMAFCTAQSPTTPLTNYNRPTSIEMNGTTYALANNAYDTITITAPLVDSMGIKILASTNVSGTSSVTGFSSIYFYLTNNPTGQIWYTQKPVFNGATVTDLQANSLTLQTPYSPSTFYPIINVPLPYGNSGVQNAFQLYTYTSAYALLNVNSRINSTDAFSVGGQLSASSNIISQGYLASNLMDVGYSNANPVLHNYGIGVNSSALRFVSNPYGLGPSFTWALNNSYTGITWGASNSNSGIMSGPIGWLGNTGGNDTLATFNYNIPINVSANTQNNSYYGALFQKLNYTAALNGITYNQWNQNGSNYFNTSKDGGKFGIGAIIPNQATNLYGNLSAPASAGFYVVDTTRGAVIARMTTSQRNNIGGVRIVTITTPGTGYTTPPVCTVTGGTGTGIRIGCYSSGGVPVLSILDPGYGYGVGNTLTGTVTGGNGSNLAFTVTTGIDSGLMIFNTDLLRYQQYTGTQWVNIGDATRTAVNDVAYTILPTDNIIAYTNLSASRAVTLPVTTNLNVGQSFEIIDEKGNANTYNITIVGTINGASNPTAINTAYGHYSFYWNGTAWFTK